MGAKIPGVISLLVFLFLAYPTAGFSSFHFTERQLDVLEKHVGKNYWVVAEEGKGPLFFSAPSPSASSFRARAKESFRITEMVGRSTKRPYYMLRFISGREGYLSVDSFLEEFNSTLVTQDPDRERERKLAREAKEAQEESRREAWIRAQPWPEHVKEAAVNRQAVLGMRTSEAKVALGKPRRVVKLRHSNPLLGDQEQWIYEGGLILIFTDGVVTRMQSTEARIE
jgi:hypothetical protein